MNDTGKTIVKNTSFLMVSQIITWSLSLLLMVFLPRFLGASAIGQFHLANSIWAIIGIFVAFGMGLMMTKEIARSKDKYAELAGTSLVIKIVFYFISIAVLAIYLQWANYSTQTLWIIVIIGISSFIGLFGSIFQTALVGNERMEYIALADIVGKFFTTFVSLTLLFLGYGIVIIATVMIATTIITVSIQGFAARKIEPIKFNFRWNLVSKILKDSFPFFLVNVFLVIYVQLDVVIISLLVNEEVIGWYSAADTLFSTLLFVPTIFLTAAFPALSRLFEEKSDALGRLMRKSFDLLFLLSIPIGLGLFVLGPEIVVLMYGEDFEKSGAVLSVMGIVLIFTYMNVLVGRFLIATNRQNVWTIVMAVALFVSIPLDLVLVPWTQSVFSNGAIGGALAFVVTESGMFILGLYLLPKGSLGKSNLWTATRIVFAGIIMVIIVWQFKDLFIAIPVLIGMVTYIGMSILLRVFPKEYFFLLQDFGKSILTKFRRSEATLS